MMLYKKCCPICGVEFETQTKVRKYCDNCKTYRKSDVSKSVRNNYIMAKTKGEPSNKLEIVCEWCGKSKILPLYLLKRVSIQDEKSWDGNIHYYCCESHKSQAYEQNGVCYWCRRPLRGTNYSSKAKITFDYCSEECEVANLKIVDKSYVHVCQNCGREFPTRGRSKNFCSEICKREAHKKGLNKESYVYVKCVYCGKVIELSESESKNVDLNYYFCQDCSKYKDEYYIATQTCIICNKTRRVRYKLPVDKSKVKKHYICQGSCKQKYIILQKNKKQF